MKATGTEKKQFGSTGKTEVKEEILPDTPLDFTFFELKSIEELLSIIPRKGQYKHNPSLKEDKNPKKIDTEEKLEDSRVSATDEKKSQNAFKPPPAESKIKMVAKQSSVPLYGAKTGGGKVKDEEKSAKEKKIIHRECNSLLLSSNQLVSFQGLRAVLDSVMYSPEKLQWLDIAYNRLQGIDNDVLLFPQLKTLYLHCNEITTLRDVRKLANLPELRNVTLYGNPISKVPHYRSYAIALLPQIFKFDSVMITKKEVVNSIVYYDHFKEKKISLMPNTTIKEIWENKHKKAIGEYAIKK